MYGDDAAAGSAAGHEATLHLHTEVFPPYSMAVDGSDHVVGAERITGSSVAIVKTLMRRAGVAYTLDLVPWKRAYGSALATANHGVFSTTRTAQREALFAWVGPLAENNWVFMGRADSRIELESLAEAGRYRIGGYLEDAIAEYLVRHGLQIDYVANDVLNVRKLARGRIDLWPVVQLKGYQLASEEGVAVKELFVIRRTEMALALNVDTDPGLVERLQRELERMRQDGTVDSIERSFFSGATAMAAQGAGR